MSISLCHSPSGGVTLHFSQLGEGTRVCIWVCLLSREPIFWKNCEVLIGNPPRLENRSRSADGSGKMSQEGTV